MHVGEKKEDVEHSTPEAPSVLAHANAGSEKRSHNPQPSSSGTNQKKAEEDEETAVPEDSKVGKKLSDLTTRRVIMLVLAMMFSVPAFTISTYKEENVSFTFGLELLNQTTEGFDSTF